MAILWRQLFDDIGVEWRDRGRNCSRGHININCPYCYDDPSFHCTISESKDVYFCYRDRRHSGGAEYLLQRLLGSRVKAINVLEDYSNSHPVVIDTTPPKLIQFDTFDIASGSPKMLDYLASRGFNDPKLTCRRFNLRYAKAGKYANRVLLPLIDEDGDIQSFVGRAIHNDMEPSYKAANPDLIANLVYGSLTGKQIVIVEGPFDALKINSALYDRLHEISCIALTGRVLSAARQRLLIRQKVQAYKLAVDADVPSEAVHRMYRELKTKLRATVRFDRLVLPSEYQDPGEMSEDAIVDWVEGGLVDAVHVGRCV